MPVRIVPLSEVPQEVAKGFSAYRRMKEWPEALSLLPRLKVNDSVEIILSKESEGMVHCSKPSQQFAAQLRRHFRKAQLSYKAWARGGVIYLSHADRNGTAALPRDGGKFKAAEGKHYQVLPENDPRIQQTRHQKPQAPAPADRGPEDGGTESPHVELPPGSEHGAWFTAGELRGMQPVEAMIHYARRHGDRLAPDKAAAFFAMAGSFGVSNEAAVESKLLELLTRGAAQKYFQPGTRGVWALRKRGAAAA